jgi:hypothetical protein
MTPALANQAENLSRIVEASLFKMEHFQTQKRPTEKESPDGPPSGLENTAVPPRGRRTRLEKSRFD